MAETTLLRCPKTKSGRLPPDELSACEFCAGTAPCLDCRVPIPPELEPLPPVTCACGQEFHPDVSGVGCPACERPADEVSRGS